MAREVSSGRTPESKPKRETRRGLERKPPSPQSVISKTVVETRGEAAYRLRRSGKTIREIAQILECQSRDVTDAINSLMKLEAGLITSEERGGILQMEMDRLDALQAAHWDSAMYGDPKSTEAILKIIALRAKFLGLDAIDPESQRQTVLVVGGNEQDYIKALVASQGEN
jgi:DNA-binding CsgD family transcriptional regulator